MTSKSKTFYSPVSAQFQPVENNKRLDLTFKADGDKVIAILVSYVFTSNDWLQIEAFLIHHEFVFDLIEELIQIEQKNGIKR